MMIFRITLKIVIRLNTYQTIDVRKDQESNTSHERGDTHGLTSYNSRHELTGININHCKRCRYLKLSNHCQGYCYPRVRTFVNERIRNMVIIVFKYTLLHFPNFYMRYCDALTQWNKHTTNAGYSSRHHSCKQNPSSSPSIHEIPSKEIGWNFYCTGYKKSKVRADVEVC